MLPDELKDFPAAAALSDWDAACIVTGRHDRQELTLEIDPRRIVDVCRFLKDTQQYVQLSTVTGVDRYPAEPRFEVVYHLQSVERNDRLRLKCRLAGGSPEIDSVTGVWRAANWYERETFDLFGISFRNHPDPRRIMLTEDFEGHPLRKDFPVTGLRV
jgi:NADH-quinone oxidoreductase subunit C